MTPEYKLIFNQMQIEIIGSYVSSNKHIDMRCKICNSEFNATPKAKVMNFKKHNKPGCPKCTTNGRYDTSRTHMLDMIADNGYKLLSDYVDTHTKVLVVNLKCHCGRSWESYPLNLKYNKNMCKPCNDEAKATRMDYYNNLRSSNAIKNMEGFELYKKQVRLLSEKHFKENEQLLTSSGSIKRGRNKYHLDHIIPISVCFENDVPFEFCADIQNLRLVKEKDNIVKNTKITTKIPSILSPYFTTAIEHDVFKKEIESCLDISLISDHEIDNAIIPLYSEEHNIGIRLALFEECRQNVAGYKALSYTNNEAARNGIRLITIFEDEWLYNKSLVISKLVYIFKKSNLVKLHARATVIRELSQDEKSEFLKLHHIQGNDKSNIAIGAFIGDKLLSVMTFAKKKAFSTKVSDSDNKIELSRFCVHRSYSVRGIASKLLNYFITNYTFKELYSFCDLRWHDGITYTKMGFSEATPQPPSYYYIVDGKRAHKWGFGKSSLKKILGTDYDDSKTEREMTLAMGYDRIWDCGRKKFVLYQNR